MKFYFCLLFALLFATFAETASACALTDDGTPVCAHWTRADAVFTGKAFRVENAPRNEGFPAGARKVRFRVEQNYKGADNPTFTVVTTADAGLPVESGQTWIIYAVNDIVVKSFTAFRGVKTEPKSISGEAALLKNIIDGKTESAIAGRAAAAARNDSGPVEITVEGGGKRFTASTDANGAYHIAVPPDAIYKVELKFPYRALVKWDDNLLGARLTDGDPTLFRYEVRLNDGDCHFSVFETSKVN